jgi:hypothetical protein
MAATVHQRYSSGGGETQEEPLQAQKRGILSLVSYVDFDLELDSAPESHLYRVLARAAVSGEVQGTFRLPVEAARFGLATDIVTQVDQNPRQFTVAPAPEAETSDPLAFGQALFTAVLGQGPLRVAYEHSWREAKRQGAGLRVRLRIRPPELAELPWELLYAPDQREYLTLSRSVSLVRYLEVAQPAEALPVQPPVRVLGMVASPRDLDRLDAIQEQQRLAAALQGLVRDGTFELTWLTGQTWRELQTALRQNAYHVLHFIGHGGFDMQLGEGFIALVDEDDGRAYRLSGDELGRLVEGNTSLRLVVLNACEGARGSRNDGRGMAAVLVQKGVPAVVAMERPIRDDDAIAFARTFYEVIAEGREVDAAVSEGRIALSLADQAGYAWSTPVLHLRTSDGRLFEFSGNAASPTDQLQSREDSVRSRAANHDSRSIVFSLGEGARIGKIEVGGNIAGRDLIVGATYAGTTSARQMSDVLEQLQLLEEQTLRLEGAPAGPREDARDELRKAREAGMQGDSRRLVEKLGTAQRYLERIGQNLPAAVTIAQSVAALTQRMRGLG